jgi:hypothetical protein
LAVFDGQEQPTSGWSIIAGKAVKLLLEALEAEVNPQVIGVLNEQLPGDKEVVVGLGGDDVH